MKDVLDFILSSLIDPGNYSIEEISGENDSLQYEIKVDKDFIGMIIGKGGNTIKSIRNILKVKATKEKKLVTLNVLEA